MFCWVCIVGRLFYSPILFCHRCDSCGWLTMPKEVEYVHHLK